jgi:hypothetical protein
MPKFQIQAMESRLFKERIIKQGVVPFQVIVNNNEIQ